MKPHEPPPRSPELPAPGGRIGPEPEDFVVDEVPAYEPSGSGEHVFVRIRKRELTTADAIRAIARVAGVEERDVGSAGMKDKHAVTTQWLSLPASSDPASWQLPEGIELLSFARHETKLRTGQQRGNRFRIRLVDVAPDALAKARAICDALERQGLYNYFGSQRFGLGGENLERALGWLSRGAPMRGKKARFYSKLYSSVVQSEHFNRYLTARAELGLDRLLAGDVVRLDGSGSLFGVEDPAREAPRLAARDIHLTGPMIGPKTRKAAGEPLALEQRIATELGLDDRALAALFRHAPGARRDLVVFPGELELSAPDPMRVELAFFLPSGSYATELVRQLTREPWLGRRFLRRSTMLARGGSDALRSAAMAVDTSAVKALAHPKLEALVEMMFLAASADGEFSDVERTEFFRSVESLTDDRLERAAVESLVERAKRDLDEQGRAARLNAVKQRLTDHAARKVALALAIQITAADGVIRTSERELILETAESLEIDRDEAADLVAELSPA